MAENGLSPVALAQLRAGLETAGSPLAADRPRAARLACLLPVVCETSSGDLFPAFVTNISSRGMRLDLERRLAKGQRVRLAQRDSAHGPVTCVVRWCRKLPHKERLLAGVEVDSPPEELHGSWVVSILGTLGYVERLDDPRPLVPPSPEPGPAPAVGEPELAEPLVEEPRPTRAPLDDTAWADLLETARTRLGAGGSPLSKLLSGLRSFALEDTVSVNERRRLGRMEATWPVECRLDKGKLTAALVDLSLGGLGLRTDGVLRKGATVVVEAPFPLGDLPPVTGKVRYTRPTQNGIRSGVVFDVKAAAGSWIAPALRQLGFGPHHLDCKRRYVRARAHLPVEARSWRGDFVQGIFLDLGRGGALLQSSSPWRSGDQVRLVVGPLGNLPLLYLQGLVLNCRQDEDGQWLVSVRFLEQNRQLDQYILALLRGLR